MNMNKFSLLLLSAILMLPFAANADKLKITRLTGNTVSIGGKNLKPGDVFDDSETIKWSSPGQQLEAKNTATGGIYHLSARQFTSKKGVSSVKDFFLRVNKASTRKAEGADLSFTPSSQASKFPERRIALIIANTNYTNISSLRNPMYDAEALASSLDKLGFDIFEAYDCDYTDMTSALNAFAQKAKGYDVALFYYSGHGLQENNHNYLIPVTANLEFKSELSRCLDAYDVLERIENSGVENRIVCLDACRDVKTSWSRSAAAGLTTMEGNPGTAIICSTRSGQVALDGEADNSPFTSAFVNALGEKGRGFSDLMSRVVKNTYESTSHRQCPIVNGTLLSDFVFNPSGEAIAKLNSQAAVATTASSSTSPTSAPRQSQTSQAAASNRVQPEVPVYVDCDVPDLRIGVSVAKRVGKYVYVDVIFNNDSGQSMKAGFVGKEPCAGFDDYITCAWDDNGNDYMMEQGKIIALKGNDRIYNPITIPAGVPVKVRLRIGEFDATATSIPLLTLAFRDLMPGESYGQALIRIRNLPLVK